MPVAYGSMNIGTTDMEILMMRIPNESDHFTGKTPEESMARRSSGFVPGCRLQSQSFVSYSPYIEQRISICIYIYTYVYIYIVILMTSTHMSIHSITIIR